jgi:TolB-like protein
MASAQVQIGNFTLQPRRQLLANGRPLPIGRKALDILSVLAESGGQLVTKDELLASAWPGVVVEENALQVHVAALRKVLGEEAERLQTVRGLGYRLDIPEQPIAPRARNGSARQKSSVAVLPFTNLTGDGAKDYLGNGIAQELISSLSRSTDLKVPSSTSSFYYKGRGADIRAIGSQLGVEMILEGWVKLSGARLRITAELIDAETGYHVWAETFERNAGDLAALEEELAAAIAAALQAKLRPLEPATRDAEAFDLYLRARSLMILPSVANLEQAIDLLRRAIGRDPNFASALAHLALGLGNLLLHGARQASILEEMRNHAERAIAADPTIWESHTALAWTGLFAGDWLIADAHSGTYDLCPVRAAVLATVGYLEAAVGQTARTLALNPSCTHTAAASGVIYMLAGNFTEALRRVAGAIALGYPAELMPLPLIRAEAALAEGDWEASAEVLIDGYGTALAKCGLPDLVRRAHAAIAGQGSPEMALAALDRFTKTPRAHEIMRDYQLGGLLISYYARLGELNGAFRIAEEIEQGRQETGLAGHTSIMMFWLPGMEDFRRDARFERLAEELGLADFWRRKGQPDDRRVPVQPPAGRTAEAAA